MENEKKQHGRIWDVARSQVCRELGSTTSKGLRRKLTSPRKAHIGSELQKATQRKGDERSSLVATAREAAVMATEERSKLFDGAAMGPEAVKAQAKEITGTLLRGLGVQDQEPVYAILGSPAGLIRNVVRCETARGSDASKGHDALVSTAM